MLGDSGFLAYVSESSIAVVVEEPAGPRLEDSGNAVMTSSIAFHATAGRRVEFRKLANEQVQLSVIVVIKPDRARTPSLRGDTSFFRHVGESAVAIVAVQNILSVLSNVEVCIS